MTWQPEDWPAPATLQLTLRQSPSGKTAIHAHLEKLSDRTLVSGCASAGGGHWIGSLRRFPDPCWELFASRLTTTSAGQSAHRISEPQQAAGQEQHREHGEQGDVRLRLSPEVAPDDVGDHVRGGADADTQEPDRQPVD